MGIFDRIKEKKRIRNELCVMQINIIESATEELNNMFAHRERFITDEDISTWIDKHKETISALQADTRPQGQLQRRRGRRRPRANARAHANTGAGADTRARANAGGAGDHVIDF